MTNKLFFLIKMHEGNEKSLLVSKESNGGCKTVKKCPNNFDRIVSPLNLKLASEIGLSRKYN